MKSSLQGADRGTFCAEFGVPVWDRALHRFGDEATFMAAQRAMPGVAAWIDPARATPIGPIAIMGQEQDLLRHFLHEGRPLALGLHVIGDTRSRTNSDYAWGSALALAQGRPLHQTGTSTARTSQCTPSLVRGCPGGMHRRACLAQPWVTPTHGRT